MNSAGKYSSNCPYLEKYQLFVMIALHGVGHPSPAQGCAGTSVLVLQQFPVAPLLVFNIIAEATRTKVKTAIRRRLGLNVLSMMIFLYVGCCSQPHTVRKTEEGGKVI